MKLERTACCGLLRAADAGKRIVLCGWVSRRRDHGSLIFVDLRDRSGICQVVFRPEASAEAHCAAMELRNEYVISVAGTVALRGAGNINPNLPTGEVELVVERLELLNANINLDEVLYQNRRKAARLRTLVEGEKDPMLRAFEDALRQTQ